MLLYNGLRSSTMKKLFTSIGNTFDSQQQSFAGKTYTVGRHVVQVEDTIAEGELVVFVLLLYCYK